MLDKQVKSPIVSIKLPEIADSKVNIDMLREDLLHPGVSGNKWRKLKYNFLEAKKLGLDKIVTFGGAYSNHIAATAACAQIYGFQSVGIIRGDELNPNSNSTLRLAHSKGMKLFFIDRTSYRSKNEPDFLKKHFKDLTNHFLIPEGGTNLFAIKGTQEILDSRTDRYEVICVAAGTGGTAAGIITSTNDNQETWVFPALKGDFLHDEISKNLLARYGQAQNWQMINDYHFGGYAKWNQELIQFINDFKALNQFRIDPIYNGKMLFGLQDMIKKGHLNNETGILAINTGGTQAVAGFNEKNGSIIK